MERIVEVPIEKVPISPASLILVPITPATLILHLAHILHVSPGLLLDAKISSLRIRLG